MVDICSLKKLFAVTTTYKLKIAQGCLITSVDVTEGCGNFFVFVKSANMQNDSLCI